MEETKQSQEFKRLTTEGENGIVTKLEKDAGKKLFYKQNTNSEPGKDLQKICESYEKAKRMTDRQPAGTKEKFKPTLDRLKYRAKSLILKAGGTKDSIMHLFGFRGADFRAKEFYFREYLIEYVINVFNSDKFFRDALKEHASNGHFVDYSLAKDLGAQLYRLLEADSDFSDDESEKAKYERHREVCEISDQLQTELNLRNKEKSKRSNLCYFLLADEDGILNPDTISVNSDEKETEALSPEISYHIISRIQNLSVTNLIELMRIYCKAYNDFYKTIIDAGKKSMKMKRNKDSYKPKRSFTAEETRDLVRLYKADGLSNKQIVETTGFKLRTVERYSKN